MDELVMDGLVHEYEFVGENPCIAINADYYPMDRDIEPMADKLSPKEFDDVVYDAIIEALSFMVHYDRACSAMKRAMIDGSPQRLDHAYAKLKATADMLAMITPVHPQALDYINMAVEKYTPDNVREAYTEWYEANPDVWHGGYHVVLMER